MAWTAALALLLNLLLPTALSLGIAASGATVAAGFCGTAPDRHAPAGAPAGPAARHCVFCLIAPTAAAAPSPSGIAGSGIAGRIALAHRPADTSIHRFHLASPQPRGPPSAV